MMFKLESYVKEYLKELLVKGEQNGLLGARIGGVMITVCSCDAQAKAATAQV